MRRLLLALVLVAALPLAASAQIEVGFDAGFTVIMPDIEGVDVDNITTFEIPFQQLRVGTYLTPNVGLEGRLGFYRESQGDFSYRQLGLLGILQYHFSSVTSGETMPFVGVGGGLINAADQDDGDTQFGVGVQGGVKVPRGDNFAFRLEGSFLRFFEGDFSPDLNMIVVSVGLSYFFR